MQPFQKLLEARKRLFGDGHLDTLEVMCNLAKSFAMLGRHQEAIDL